VIRTKNSIKEGTFFGHPVQQTPTPRKTPERYRQEQRCKKGIV